MSSLAGPETGVPAIDDPAFFEILQLLRERTGTDFSSYKLPTVARRTVNRMISVGAQTYADYLQLLRQREGEAARLLEHVTIKISRFYRHAPTFDMLRRQVLPELARQAQGRALTIWSVGCGCGEEPYTLAMLCAEAGLSWTIEATDIDPAALRTAAHGCYPNAALYELPKDLRERFLVRIDGSLEVSPELREQVRFSHHDVLAARPPPGAGEFDLVCFRNVLIYLGHEVQELALHSIRRAVRHDGYLCLGESEWLSPAVATTLTPLGQDTRIFRAAPLRIAS
ncbi:MAG TPA: protein-glutamate O-methyltransferase CheR [Steroidobacteraceae bacterium]|nr:protein-glutamate O-methyltransferase CheR [Steroidobacteraceae bacterium]